MADIGFASIWPAISGVRVAGISQTAYWQRRSTDLKYWITTSSTAVTHYSAELSSQVGLQPYPGTASRMILKGSASLLLQITVEAADSTFFYHADVWLGSSDSGGSLAFVASSSDESFYFGSSSSTGIFAVSTAASTNIYMGTRMPQRHAGVRIWEAE